MPRVDMTLPDTEGRPYDFRAETEGRVAVLFFGYTYCPDICPVHMSTLASALADLGPDARSGVDVVFVSVDPERDSPERIRSWLDAFDTTFVGLTGTPEQLADALAFYRYPPPEKSAEGTRIYTVGHPALMYAFGADGLGYAMYGPETTRAVWAHDLALLTGFPWDAAASASTASEVPDGPILGQKGALRVLDVYAPEPAGGDAAALYLSVRNTGSEADTLLAVRSLRAARSSLHRTAVVDGVARMEERAGVVLPPGERVELAPGGTHVMLGGVTAGAFRAGTVEVVTLEFARAGSLTVQARVVAYDELPG